MSDNWDVYYLNYDEFTAGGSLSGGLQFTSGGSADIPASETSQAFYDIGSDANPITSGGTLESGSSTDGQYTDYNGFDTTINYLGTVTLSTGSGTVTALVGWEVVGSGTPQTVIVLSVPSGSFGSASQIADNNSTFGQSSLDTSNYVLTPCFTAGTMIRTPDGERAVEDLRAGDLVLTAEGVAKPIRWAGRSTVVTRFADPVRTLPVRVKAGALGENLPVRDLLLSPAHAVLLDGALVQASALVNGSSVVRETAVPGSFLYYHLETDAHDVLVSEGVPSESFLAAADDIRFDNWAERPADVAPGAELAYPRVKSARQLPASVRRTLAQRAAAIAVDLDAAA